MNFIYNDTRYDIHFSYDDKRRKTFVTLFEQQPNGEYAEIHGVVVKHHAPDRYSKAKGREYAIRKLLAKMRTDGYQRDFRCAVADTFAARANNMGVPTFAVNYSFLANANERAHSYTPGQYVKKHTKAA